MTRPTLVDLHLHTTASDGRCSPRELVDRAVDAGLTVIAATDHDTTAGIAEVQASARAAGIEAISGIEITSVHDGTDVHVLGYFFDPADAPLGRFLAEQRAIRVSRLVAIAERVAELGMPIDVEPLLENARQHPNRSVGRPQIARALVAAGYVADVREAFEQWLGRGRPAFVDRPGASPAHIVGIVHGAGGVVSMAHPGRTSMDELIPPLVDAGLDALEVYHSDHDQAAIARYAAIAQQYGLLVTGGSDYHGDPARSVTPGSSSLPPDDWERLRVAGHRDA
jgi:predicted metal-dependent phosphoesterase TrpH